MLEVARWDDDITHDPLCMRITKLSLPNLTQPILFTSDIRPHVFHFSRMVGQNLIKFGMDIIPWVTIQNTYFRTFLHFVIPSWRILKFASWDEDDIISHDPLRMRITSLTVPNVP
jgi:hypothetical protein